MSDDAVTDDDWFERALRERGDDDDERGVDDETEAGDEKSVDEAASDEASSDDLPFHTDRSEPVPDDGIDADGRDEEPIALGGDSADEGAISFDAENLTGESADGSASDSLFDRDFAAEFEDIDVPGVDAAAGPAAFSDLEFGLGTGEETDFEADADSDLARIDLGIDGLDRMIQGGVPERSLMVAIGSAGTGKTTFGLQFLGHGLAQGDRAVYITLEESHDRVVNSATEKGYPFDEYVADGRLAIVDVDPIEMAHSLETIRSELPRLIEEFGASRLVLDSVSLLEMMYENRAKRRNEIFDFTRSLKRAGVTAMLTSEASEASPYASRYGIVEYLTDAVFVLQYVRPNDFRETRLAIEIQKIRDANHSREMKPYEITDEGISVYQQANLF